MPTLPPKLMAGLCGVALLTLVGCGPAATQPDGGSVQRNTGPVGKAVVALSPQTTSSVDPQLQSEGSDFVNTEVLYNRLREAPKDSLALGPGLATKWALSPDAKTATFDIRKGVKFHNGDEVTPEDVVFSIERARRIGTQNAKAYLELFLESMEVKGESVLFHLKRPNSWNFVNQIARGEYSVVPKKYIEQVGDEGFLKAPVGTGPFKFVSWARQEYLEVQAVDYEHFMWQPGVERLRYVIVPEETTRLAMLRTSEADLAQISVTSLKSMEGDTKIRALRVPNLGGLRIFMFGQADPANPMSKLEVRQALSLAIDREAIAKGVYQGYARPIGTGIWNPAEPGFPDWGNTAPAYDLERAKALLVKAGYPDGKGLKLTFHSFEFGATPLFTQVAPVIAGQWGKMGVQVELRQWERAAYTALAITGKFDPVAVSTNLANSSGAQGSIGDFTPLGQYPIAAGTAGGAHPELKQMAEQYLLEVDATKRAQLQGRILAYDRDNVVFMPVLIIDGLWATGPRVREYTPRPGTFSQGNMYTIKVEP